MLRSVLLAAALVPHAALALPWDGTYRLGEDADCEAGTGTLRIEEGVFHGTESTCRMTDAVDVLDLDATLYVMQCEGEGQTWSERAMFMEAAEGDAIFLAWRGYVFRYDRCPTPEDASADPADDAAPEANEEVGSDDADAPDDGAGEGPETDDPAASEDAADPPADDGN